jgi:hypothetical protein
VQPNGHANGGQNGGANGAGNGHAAAGLPGFGVRRPAAAGVPGGLRSPAAASQGATALQMQPSQVLPPLDLEEPDQGPVLAPVAVPDAATPPVQARRPAMTATRQAAPPAPPSATPSGWSNLFQAATGLIRRQNVPEAPVMGRPQPVPAQPARTPARPAPQDDLGGIDIPTFLRRQNNH